MGIQACQCRRERLSLAYSQGPQATSVGLLVPAPRPLPRERQPPRTSIQVSSWDEGSEGSSDSSARRSDIQRGGYHRCTSHIGEAQLAPRVRLAGANSFHEKADPCQELVLFFPVRVFALSMILSISVPFSQAAWLTGLPRK